MRAIRRFTVRTVLPEQIAALGDLANNLRWSWHPPTMELFASLDPTRWAASRHDPIALLGRFSPEELDAFASDPAFVARVGAAAADLDRYMHEPRWYQAQLGRLDETVKAPAAIAYFSPEFGITAVLPQYSGGLGILAGDHLKSASDLGVPIVGVGLLYQYGYFKQSLTGDGWQREEYPVLDPNELPISMVYEDDGTPATVSVALPGGRTLLANVWKAQVGRVPLLMLDSNHESNDEAARGVTDRLYGGSSEHRLQQEMLLGIGGVRALRLWSRLTGAPAPDVYHTNEGHAGFLGLERISELVSQQGLSVDSALEEVRAATVFTTHTPVPAGIDRFGRDLMVSHFSGPNQLAGLPIDRVLEIGAENYPNGDPAVFNMAVMGLRLSQRANGVSQLHGVVSRDMFVGLWPGFDPGEVPITSITNGVHAPTWVDARMIALAEKHIGPRITTEAKAWEEIEKVPVGELWAVRRQLRSDLVDDARKRVRASWIKRGASRAELGWTDSVLDPDVLTIGFARRVPTYKRLTLMLRDPVRLKRLLLHPERPIQLVIAGKSHPADETGKRLIQQLVRFADDPEVRHRIVFLPNYDIAMAQVLYPGCDVWLNNPLRPFEACGTSGMKSALNGGLNLSILDGWWDEWYDGENGWAIPTADGVVDPDRRDDLEAAALYDLIEREVTPRFYTRDAEGLPQRWLAMVKHTFSSLGPKVLASRMVADYTRQLYVPASTSGSATGPDVAATLASFKTRLRAAWPAVRVEHVDSSGVSAAPQVGDELQVRAVVALGALAPADVDVQVVHGRVSPSDTLTDTVVASLAPTGEGADGKSVFEGVLKLRRTGPFGYTVRVLPAHGGLANPAELGLVVNASSGAGSAGEAQDQPAELSDPRAEAVAAGAAAGGAVGAGPVVLVECIGMTAAAFRRIDVFRSIFAVIAHAEIHTTGKLPEDMGSPDKAWPPRSRNCPCTGNLPLRTVIGLDIDRYRFLAQRDQDSSTSPLVTLRVLLFYPGLYGVLAYRLTHAARSSSLPGPLRTAATGLAILAQRMLLVFSGVEMSAQAHVGPGLFINHSRGVVIGAIDAGDNLTISHAVTLGQATGMGDDPRRCPEFGDRVWLGVGSVVTGGIRIGHDAVVGANAVVLHDVPDRGVAVGVPARVVSTKGSFATVLFRHMELDLGRADSLRRGSMDEEERKAHFE